MRSLLFVPGDDERKLARGLASAADALILDLEDAVAPARKSAARKLCAETIAAAKTPKKLFVRVNGLDTGETLADLTVVVPAGPFGIVLPKCRGGADVRALADELSKLESSAGVAPGRIRILPIATETAASMFGLGSYGPPAHPRLFGLMWGGEDLAADLGAIANRDAQGGAYTAPYQLARSLCLYAAAAASVPAIDAVFVDFRDAQGLKAEAEEGVRDGFSGKAAIHPDQVAVINAAFTPTEADIERARRIVAAFSASTTGVASLDGRMLDRPHLRSAQRVLDRARQAGLSSPASTQYPDS